MLLSENVFDGVAGRLGADADPAPGGQRRGPRATLRTRLTVVPCPAWPDGPFGPPLSVPARDLSRGGVRFLLPRRLPLDTNFVLLMPAPAEGNASSLAVLCAVTYWQPLAPDLFAIGGQFRAELTADALPATLLAAEPRVVLPGMAGDEPGGAATFELLRRAAC